MIVFCVTLLLLHQGYALVPVTTVQLGESVTFSCVLPLDDLSSKRLYWYKQSVGDDLKLIVTFRKHINPVFGPEFSDSRLDLKVEKNISKLTILRTTEEDDGMYHCAVIEWTENFWSGTYLSLKGNSQRTLNYTVVQQPTASDPVRPGDLKTLQCSVLSDSETKTCPGDHNVFWFRVGSDKSHPNILYTDGNRRDECEDRSDTQKSCVHHFSKKVSSSDAGTYYCAVATCGEILFGNGPKVEFEDDFSATSSSEPLLVFLLCAALASLAVGAFLLYGCTDDLNFEMMTVEVGHDVTLTCVRHDSLLSTFNLFWIRLVSGNMPELLGGTHSFDFDGVNKTPRITAKQGDGTFLLHISEAQLSDTGLYYCVTVKNLHMTFVEGTFLRIKGPEPDVTAVIQLPPSDPVRPGDSVTLQCSVLSDSQNKPCPGNHSVFWFRAGSDESEPSFIYAHGNSGAECETSLEARSPQKCVYSFSKNVSSSDAGTYYCAVATCGEILFGNGTKLDIEGLSMADALVYLLCAVLAISLVVVAFLIYLFIAAVAGQKISGGQKSQQTDVDMRLYSAAVFTVMKTDRGVMKHAEAAETERIYSAVKTFGLDQ
ncbi:uncharacterized protein LOC119008074 [Acanthopagrus latus]|uniref:uncharacterized protein LOC119008074 n=1 Tax=Acanthopagrus latus TaxID=8177 RepID=UPI00187CA448|nr:uncharacterized protein LOC119008074 [Acanthopagrus latus]